MSNKDFITHKTVLAKLMATENIKVQVKNIPTAMFDLKTRTLVIPAMKDDVSQEMFNLFVGHEVSHAINTPQDGWEKAIKKEGIPLPILNVMEDVRIERLIQRKFPGLKKEFFAAYQQMMDKDFFGIKQFAKGDPNTLEFLDRLNVYAKCGIRSGVKFTKEEIPFVERAEKTETFEEVKKLCHDVIEFLKKQYEFPQETKPQFVPGDGNGDGDGEGNSQGNQSQDKNGQQGSQPAHNEVGGGGVLDKILDVKTQANFDKEKKKLQDAAGVIHNVNIPIITAKDVVYDWKVLFQELSKSRLDGKDLYRDFQNRNKAIIQYLVKEFELRKNANQMKKAQINKTGDLDLKRIFSYQFSEDLFRRNTVITEGKSHGLVMFVDWSGSMAPHIIPSIEQILCITEFCRKVNIPFEVYCFSDAHVGGNIVPRSIKQMPGNLHAQDFSLLNVLSNKMPSLDYKKTCGMLLHSVRFSNATPAYMRLGGTPLNDCIMAAMEIVPEFQKKNNLQIVNTIFVTDGDSNATNCYWKSQSQYESLHNGTIFLEDQRTHNVVQFKADNPQKITRMLLTQLRNRTQSNVIGFYLYPTERYVSDIINHCSGESISRPQMETLKAQFLKENFVSISSRGYTEFYIVNASKTLKLLNLKKAINVTEKTTIEDINKTFMDVNKKNILNRVLLSRFIDLIT